MMDGSGQYCNCPQWSQRRNIVECSSRDDQFYECYCENKTMQQNGAERHGYYLMTGN